MFTLSIVHHLNYFNIELMKAIHCSNKFIYVCIFKIFIIVMGLTSKGKYKDFHNTFSFSY